MKRKDKTLELCVIVIFSQFENNTYKQAFKVQSDLYNRKLIQSRIKNTLSFNQEKDHFSLGLATLPMKSVRPVRLSVMKYMKGRSHLNWPTG